MKYLIEKDKKIRSTLVRAEPKSRALGALAVGSQALDFKSIVMLRLHHHVLRSTSSSKVRNRCVNTGRSKSVFRFFKLSRIKLRELASGSSMSGITKSSW